MKTIQLSALPASAARELLLTYSLPELREAAVQLGVPKCKNKSDLAWRLAEYDAASRIEVQFNVGVKL